MPLMYLFLDLGVYIVDAVQQETLSSSSRASALKCTGVFCGSLELGLSVEREGTSVKRAKQAAEGRHFAMP